MNHNDFWLVWLLKASYLDITTLAHAQTFDRCVLLALIHASYAAHRAVLQRAYSQAQDVPKMLTQSLSYKLQ